MVTEDEVRQLAEEFRAEFGLPSDQDISNEYLCEFLSASVRRAKSANLGNVYLGHNPNRKSFASFRYSEELKHKFDAIEL